MTKPTITIRQATLNDNDPLTKFRVSQFLSAKEFKLSGTNSFSMQSGIVWVATIEDEIISTMQAEIVNTDEVLSSKTTCHLPDNIICFDTLYLSKGATHQDYRNTGLNSYLRLLILETVLQTQTINSLSGVAYENAPRLNLLSRLGYTMTEVQEKADSVYKPNGKVFLLELKRKNFKIALNTLEVETKQLIDHFDIQVITS